MRIFVLALIVLLAPGLTPASEFPVADRVVIEKGARLLHLMSDGKAFRTFKIALGIRPVGDKKSEGDFKTPEGKYTLDRRNPNSDFFLSIHVSYPNSADRREAAELGVSPGGAIIRTQDWTNGCIAVSNSDMIDIWLMTSENTPIEIRP
jgi:murein L,D-transpeptidase YafK